MEEQDQLTQFKHTTHNDVPRSKAAATSCGSPCEKHDAKRQASHQAGNQRHLRRIKSRNQPKGHKRGQSTPARRLAFAVCLPAPPEGRHEMSTKFGARNIMAISGGRITGLPCGILMPSGQGYSVSVMLNYKDPYTVTRWFKRGDYIERSQLELTEELMSGGCWIFSGNSAGAGRGVSATLKFRVWKQIEGGVKNG